MKNVFQMFTSWLIILTFLIVVIGIPVYLVYLVNQYINKFKHKKNTLENKVEELEMRVKELERKKE